VKIQNDGTNLNFYLSPDGNHWGLYHSETITTFLAAATSVAWGCYQNTFGAAVSLLDWTQGT
jgi:hypothetical protein